MSCLMEVPGPTRYNVALPLPEVESEAASPAVTFCGTVTCAAATAESARAMMNPLTSLMMFDLSCNNSQSRDSSEPRPQDHREGQRRKAQLVEDAVPGQDIHPRPRSL